MAEPLSFIQKYQEVKKDHLAVVSLLQRLTSREDFKEDRISLLFFIHEHFPKDEKLSYWISQCDKMIRTDRDFEPFKKTIETLLKKGENLTPLNLEECQFLIKLNAKKFLPLLHLTLEKSNHLSTLKVLIHKGPLILPNEETLLRIFHLLKKDQEEITFEVLGMIKTTQEPLSLPYLLDTAFNSSKRSMCDYAMNVALALPIPNILAPLKGMGESGKKNWVQFAFQFIQKRGVEPFSELLNSWIEANLHIPEILSILPDKFPDLLREPLKALMEKAPEFREDIGIILRKNQPLKANQGEPTGMMPGLNTDELFPENDLTPDFLDENSTKNQENSVTPGMDPLGEEKVSEKNAPSLSKDLSDGLKKGIDRLILETREKGLFETGKNLVKKKSETLALNMGKNQIIQDQINPILKKVALVIYERDKSSPAKSPYPDEIFRAMQYKQQVREQKEKIDKIQPEKSADFFSNFLGISDEAKRKNSVEGRKLSNLEEKLDKILFTLGEKFYKNSEAKDFHRLELRMEYNSLNDYYGELEEIELKLLQET